MQKILLIITLIFLTSCGKDMFTFPSTRDVPTDVTERVEKILRRVEVFHLVVEKMQVEFLTLLHQTNYGELQ